LPPEISARVRRFPAVSCSSNSGACAPLLSIASCFREAILISVYSLWDNCCAAISSGSHTVENGGA